MLKIENRQTLECLFICKKKSELLGIFVSISFRTLAKKLKEKFFK